VKIRVQSKKIAQAIRVSRIIQNQQINLKVTFLGTGTSQGVPVIGCDCAVCLSENARDRRLRSSILVSTDDTNLVIDCGPDFRQQMILSGIAHLDAVLLTHEHNDHIIGMDDVRPFNFRSRKNMPVYATASVQADLLTRFAYIFAKDPYPGAPRLELNTIDKSTPFQIKDMEVRPVEVMHGKMPVLGFRFGNFTYITDAKTITDKEFSKLEGTETLVLNALHHRTHHAHLNLEEALEWVERIAPKKAYLLHISHLMGKHDEINPQLPENVELAYDGLILEV